MNVEIFQKLLFSSLVIVDLTGIRPNCMFEYGLALGLNKKVIVMAREDTDIPWDVSAMPCYFWSAFESYERRINDLKDFMSKNLNRSSIFY